MPCTIQENVPAASMAARTVGSSCAPAKPNTAAASRVTSERRIFIGGASSGRELFAGRSWHRRWGATARREGRGTFAPMIYRDVPLSVTRGRTFVSRGGEGPLPPPQPRVQHVSQPIPQEQQSKPQQGDGDAREGREPPRRRQVVAAVGQHASPGDGGWLHAEPEERQRRLEGDGGRDVQGADHQDRGRDRSEERRDGRGGAEGRRP